MVWSSIFLVLYFGSRLSEGQGTNEAYPQEAPWTAGLVTRLWEPICSGTIVSANYILTASFCLLEKDENDTVVIKEPHDILIVFPSVESPGNVRKTGVLILHPKAFKKKLQYSAGLVGFGPPLTISSISAGKLALWNADAHLLHNLLQYIKSHPRNFDCMMFAWRDPDARTVSTRPPYVIKTIRKFELQLEKVSCADILDPPKPANNNTKHKADNSSKSADPTVINTSEWNGTTCAKILKAGVPVVDADRGAGLRCSDDLWGVYLGAVGKHPRAVLMFADIDSVSTFILDFYLNASLIHNRTSKRAPITSLMLLLGSIISAARLSQ